MTIDIPDAKMILKNVLMNWKELDDCCFANFRSSIKDFFAGVLSTREEDRRQKK